LSSAEFIYECTNGNDRDHRTPRRNERGDTRIEPAPGKSEDEYLRTLIEGELLSQKSFAEILAPIREGFRKSGMTEENSTLSSNRPARRSTKEDQTEKE
jgi:hypothetical protein